MLSYFFSLKLNYYSFKIAEGIAEGVTTFRDETLFKGKQIFIYKRAQILAADLSTAIKCFKNQDKTLLKNVEKLTMFADYRIPQILRHYGIIDYEANLKNKIDSKIELEPNSTQEVHKNIINNLICLKFDIV